MKTKIITGTLAFALFLVLGVQYADADRGNGLYEMRQNGDMNEARERFQNRVELTDEQRQEIAELRESGDREQIREKMQEFGAGQRGASFLDDLSDEQREELAELREDGDREAIHDQLAEWGIEAPYDQRMEALADYLDDDEFEALEEAHETIRDILDEHKDDLEDRGIRGFLGRIGGFFKGLFK